MAQVTLPYTLTAGTPENVNNLMSNLTALRDGVNTIDTAQIANGAITSAKLASGVGGAADGSITDAKLATALADNLAITNGGNTRRTSVTATTERTTTSATYSDVTGASLTLTIPSNSVLTVALSAELKNSAGAGYGTVLRVVAGSTNIQPFSEAGFYKQHLALSYDTAYSATGAIGSAHSAVTGTGSQTVKVQFATNELSGTKTAYVKNVYLTAWVMTY